MKCNYVYKNMDMKLCNHIHLWIFNHRCINICNDI